MIIFTQYKFGQAEFDVDVIEVELLPVIDVEALPAVGAAVLFQVVPELREGPMALLRYVLHRDDAAVRQRPDGRHLTYGDLVGQEKRLLLQSEFFQKLQVPVSLLQAFLEHLTVPVEKCGENSLSCSKFYQGLG